MLVRRAGWAAEGRGCPVGGAPVSGAGPGARPHHGDGPVQLVGDPLGTLHRWGRVAVSWGGWAVAPALCATLGRAPARTALCLHPRHAEPRDPSVAERTGTQHVGLGSLALTTSGARVSAGLALGEILAPGDMRYAGFSVGGKRWLRGLVVRRLRPPPRGLLRPVLPALPVDPHLGGSPPPPLPAASLRWPSGLPGRCTAGVRWCPGCPPHTGAWACDPRGGWGQCPQRQSERPGSPPGVPATTVWGTQATRKELS